MKIINKSILRTNGKNALVANTYCDPSGSVLHMFQKLGFKDCKDVAYGYALYVIPLHSKAHVYCSSPELYSDQEL